MHFPSSRFYLRRVTVPSGSDLLAPLRAAGYRIEASHYDPDNSVVVEIPVDVGQGVRTLESGVAPVDEDVDAMERLYERYWMAAYGPPDEIHFDPRSCASG